MAALEPCYRKFACDLEDEIMCYAKPGPRCSNHARKNLDRVREEHKVARKDLLYAEENRKDLRRGELKKKKERFYELMEELTAAENDFYSTPAGFRELEAKMAATSSKDWVYDNLSKQLEAGRRVRERQFALYNAEKHKGEAPHQYVADEEDMDELVNNLRTGYGEENVYVGRAKVKPVKLDEKLVNKYAVLQKRCDVLVDCFRDRNGDFRINSDIVKAYDSQGLIPGFKYLGSGSFKAAFLDERTGYVIKIPGKYSTRVDAHRNDIAELPLNNEQSSYAILDVGKLNELDGEYVETLFYNDSRGSGVNVVVQPYLNQEDYVFWEDLPGEERKNVDSKIEKMNNMSGLWDLGINNFRVHKESGRIVLFDCLNPNKH